MPGKDALTGVVPDIGVEQGAPHPPQCSDLGNPRQRRDDRLDTGYLRVGEATGLPRCAGHRVNGAVGEDERQREIIGYPFSAKLRKNRKIHGTIRVGKLAAERAPGRVNLRNRVLEEFRAFEKLEWRFRNLDRSPRPPNKAPAHDLWVQSAHEHCDPPQRNTEGNEPLR